MIGGRGSGRSKEVLGRVGFRCLRVEGRSLVGSRKFCCWKVGGRNVEKVVWEMWLR